jgi:hypothetical protein
VAPPYKGNTLAGWCPNFSFSVLYVLGVLCGEQLLTKIHHRDTENPENAQRLVQTRTLHIRCFLGVVSEKGNAFYSRGAAVACYLSECALHKNIESKV